MFSHTWQMISWKSIRRHHGNYSAIDRMVLHLVLVWYCRSHNFQGFAQEKLFVINMINMIPFYSSSIFQPDTRWYELSHSDVWHFLISASCAPIPFARVQVHDSESEASDLNKECLTWSDFWVMDFGQQDFMKITSAYLRQKLHWVSLRFPLQRALSLWVPGYSLTGVDW